MHDSCQHIVRTTRQWNDRPFDQWPIPRGVMCVELSPDGQTWLKIGTGHTIFRLLPYVTINNTSDEFYSKDEIDSLLSHLRGIYIVSDTVYVNPEALPMESNNIGDVRFVMSPNPDISPFPLEYVWTQVNGAYNWIPLGSVFYDAFVGATQTTNGSPGLVPPPTAGQQGYYLRGDGEWTPPPLTGVTDITQDDPRKLNELTIHYPDHTKKIDIPSGGSGPTGDIYTPVDDAYSFTVLTDEPPDWEAFWFNYFSLSYDEITTEPPLFDPTKHYYFNGSSHVPGIPGETWSSHTWYDRHYLHLSNEQPIPFVPNLYYKGTIKIISDGEDLGTSFGKLNESIQILDGILANKVDVKVDSIDENLILYN